MDIRKRRKKNQISTKGAEERQVSAPGPQTAVVAVSVSCGNFEYWSVCLSGSDDHPFLGRCPKGADDLCFQEEENIFYMCESIGHQPL